MKSKIIIDELIKIVSKDFQNDQKVPYFSGQNKKNFVYIDKDSKSGPNFEFGDLRVEFKNVRVIVEVDTAGGVTNLAKYFFMLNEKEKFNFNDIEPDKSTYLLHIFVCKNETDYLAHRKLWFYIQNNIKNELDADKFISKMEVWYTDESKSETNEQVKTKFENLLKEARKK